MLFRRSLYILLPVLLSILCTTFGVRLGEYSVHDDIAENGMPVSAPGGKNLSEAIRASSNVLRRQAEALRFAANIATYISEFDPRKDYQGKDFIKVDSDPRIHAYLRFDDLPAMQNIKQIMLVLMCTRKSKSGGVIYASKKKVKKGIIWENRLDEGTLQELVDIGRVELGQELEVDISNVISQGSESNSLSLVIKSTDGASGASYSKEDIRLIVKGDDDTHEGITTTTAPVVTHTTAVTKYSRGEGMWGKQVFNMKLIPIHSLVMPTNEILSYGTTPTGKRKNNLSYEVWNLGKGGGYHEQEAHILLEQRTNTDIFCSSMNIDPATGNAIIFGGDMRYPGSDHSSAYGNNKIRVFNYKTKEITMYPHGDMKYERWYGSSINLANGDIFVVGGRGAVEEGSPIPELWSSGEKIRQLNGAKIPAIAQSTNKHWWYPYTWQNSKGNIIIIMPFQKNSDCYRVDVNGDGSIDKIGTKPFKQHVRSPAIMFRTDQILTIDDTGLMWVANIANSNKIKWEEVNKLGYGRTNGSMAMLPDGRVIITGGCKDTDDAGIILEEAAKAAQIWDPMENEVFSGSSEKMARLYHSINLLMPNGMLLSAGGGSPGPVTNLNGQLFTPDYFYNEDQEVVTRPVIIDCPCNVKTSSKFTITVSNKSISKVTAIKSGAASHTRNFDTRWLQLNFTPNKDGTELEVESQDFNTMIAGLWMMYVLDSNGVPSEACLIGVNMGVKLDECNTS